MASEVLANSIPVPIRHQAIKWNNIDSPWILWYQPGGNFIVDTWDINDCIAFGNQTIRFATYPSDNELK